MEEKITLTEEQAKRFMEEYNQGDIWGFEELQKILKEEIKIKDNNANYTIFDLLKDVILLNNMFVYGCQSTNSLGEYTIEIETLYNKLKVKLFNQFTNNFEKYW